MAVTQVSFAQSDLLEELKNDIALQDATIILLRSALGARNQTNVVRRGRFTDEIRIYVGTYRATREPTTLANIQNRYAVSKSELLESRLPGTIEELVSILEQLWKAQKPE